MIKDMSPKEFVERRAGGGKMTLLDVREDWETTLAPVPADIVHIPMGQVADRVGELDPQQETVVICRSGGRSREVARFLSTQGLAKWAPGNNPKKAEPHAKAKERAAARAERAEIAAATPEPEPVEEPAEETVQAQAAEDTEDTVAAAEEAPAEASVADETPAEVEAAAEVAEEGAEGAQDQASEA